MNAARALAFAAALLALPVEAAECPLTRAVYTQPQSDWQLSFRPRERDSAANKTASFTLAIPSAGAVFYGGVYEPNGFGRPQASLTLTCRPNYNDPDCRFWEGPVYGNDDSGLSALRVDDGMAAPHQVLLADFAIAVWYSKLRNDAFPDDGTPGDVFTLSRCRDADDAEPKRRWRR